MYRRKEKPSHEVMSNRTIDDCMLCWCLFISQFSEKKSIFFLNWKIIYLIFLYWVNWYSQRQTTKLEVSLLKSNSTLFFVYSFSCVFNFFFSAACEHVWFVYDLYVCCDVAKRISMITEMTFFFITLLDKWSISLYTNTWLYFCLLFFHIELRSSHYFIAVSTDGNQSYQLFSDCIMTLWFLPSDSSYTNLCFLEMRVNVLSTVYGNLILCYKLHNKLCYVLCILDISIYDK